VGRIDDIFTQLRSEGGKGLMPFVCAGYPNPGTTAAVLPALSRAGASIIEVGIPFSDPIADGSVIAAAMHKALEQGCTPISVFDSVSQARPQVDAGLVAMVSISIVQRPGPQKFAEYARNAGFDGLIVPDCPLEESDTLRKAAADNGLTLSFLIAPSTNPRRAEAIAKACTGFVYLLARSGITGERTEAPQIEPRVTRLRQMTDLPIAVGFGISNPDQVRAVVAHADAAIVGSPLVRRMGDAAAGGADPISEATTFIRLLSEGLPTPRRPQEAVTAALDRQ
jgi:tryptophan synthase alpha chain